MIYEIDVGSQQVRKFSSRRSSADMSFGSSVKPYKSAFSVMRARCCDLGIITTSCCSAQRNRTWAGVFACFRAIAPSVGVVEFFAARQRTIGLDLNSVCPAEFQQLPLIEEGTEFDLIDRRHDIRVVHKFLQVRNGIVAHAD